MYLTYFDKFRNMEPYIYIDEEEWNYIKKNFERHDIQDSLVEILADYEPPYQVISKKQRE